MSFVAGVELVDDDGLVDDGVLGLIDELEGEDGGVAGLIDELDDDVDGGVLGVVVVDEDDVDGDGVTTGGVVDVVLASR